MYKITEDIGNPFREKLHFCMWIHLQNLVLLTGQGSKVRNLASGDTEFGGFSETFAGGEAFWATVWVEKEEGFCNRWYTVNFVTLITMLLLSQCRLE